MVSFIVTTIFSVSFCTLFNTVACRAPDHGKFISHGMNSESIVNNQDHLSNILYGRYEKYGSSHETGVPTWKIAAHDDSDNRLTLDSFDHSSSRRWLNGYVEELNPWTKNIDASKRKGGTTIENDPQDKANLKKGFEKRNDSPDVIFSGYKEFNLRSKGFHHTIPHKKLEENSITIRVRRDIDEDLERCALRFDFEEMIKCADDVINNLSNLSTSHEETSDKYSSTTSIATTIKPTTEKLYTTSIRTTIKPTTEKLYQITSRERDEEKNKHTTETPSNTYVSFDDVPSCDGYGSLQECIEYMLHKFDNKSPLTPIRTTTKKPTTTKRPTTDWLQYWTTERNYPNDNWARYTTYSPPVYYPPVYTTTTTNSLLPHKENLRKWINNPPWWASLFIAV